MGNMGLGGSKRQSYSPGEAKDSSGQHGLGVPENGGVGVKAGANGKVQGDVTTRVDVIAAGDDSSGAVTPTSSSSVPATPTTTTATTVTTTATASSPASPVSPTEKKKRRVPKFVFSLRRTGSGKRSRKPRTAEANGVRPVSYTFGASGSSPASAGGGGGGGKGRPQKITIPEDDGKIETVSLSSSDDNVEKDQSKKEKKKEGSQKKKSSKKKKDKGAKSKADKTKKGAKDKDDTPAGKETPKENENEATIEKSATAVIAAVQETVRAKSQENETTVGEHITTATAMVEQSLPANSQTPVEENVTAVATTVRGSVQVKSKDNETAIEKTVTATVAAVEESFPQVKSSQEDQTAVEKTVTTTVAAVEESFQVKSSQEDQAAVEKTVTATVAAVEESFPQVKSSQEDQTAVEKTVTATVAAVEESFPKVKSSQEDQAAVEKTVTTTVTAVEECFPKVKSSQEDQAAVEKTVTTTVAAVEESFQVKPSQEDQTAVEKTVTTTVTAVEESFPKVKSSQEDQTAVEKTVTTTVTAVEESFPKVKSFREDQTTVEENLTPTVSTVEESLQTKQPREENAGIEELIIAAVANTEETKPFKQSLNETQLVQEVMVVELAKPSEQTPDHTATESGVQNNAEDDSSEAKSEAETQEAKTSENQKTPLSQEEETRGHETQTKQDEVNPATEQCRAESESQEEQKENNDETREDKAEDKAERDKEDKAEGVKATEDKPEEDKATRTEETKLSETVMSEIATLVEGSKDELNMSTDAAPAATEEVEVVLEPSVATVAHTVCTGIKIERETSPEIEQVTAVKPISEEAEQQIASDVMSDSKTALENLVVNDIKNEPDSVVTEPEATKETRAEPSNEIRQTVETLTTGLTQTVPAAQEQTESSETPKDGCGAADITESIVVALETKDQTCQDTATSLSTQVADDNSTSDNKAADGVDKEIVVEDVVMETMSAQVQTAAETVPSMTVMKSAPEQVEALAQSTVVSENSNDSQENGAVDTVEERPAESEKESEATASKEQEAEGAAARPEAAEQIPAEGETQAAGENSPPLSPSQIKAMEKERKAAKKKEEKEKARKEKEEKKRLKELKKQEARDKKQKEKEEKERKLRELKEKSKAAVNVNVEVKRQEAAQEETTESAADKKDTDSAPSKAIRTGMKPEEEASSSKASITEHASISVVKTETKQEETNAVDSDTQSSETMTDAQSTLQTEAAEVSTPSTISESRDKNLATKVVESISIKPQQLGDSQDTETPTTCTEEIARQSTSSATSTSSDSAASGPYSPATPDSPFSEPRSPDTNLSEDSAPTSPVSPDTGDTARSGPLKKIVLGPRLRTAILRKSSSGAESEEKRVSLTQPRFVQAPTQLTPPPRKQRPRRPLEQVWSPLGDYATNRARNAKKSPPGQAESQAVVEEFVTVSQSSNSESSPAPSVPHTERKTEGSQREEADINQQQTTVTASVNCDSASALTLQKESPDTDASIVKTLGGEVEKLMTVSVTTSVESVPALGASQSVSDDTGGEISGLQEVEMRRHRETAAFVFDTPLLPSAPENTTDDTRTSDVTADDDGGYKVMRDLSSPGSRVSIHSDPSSPTVVSVASIVLSGQVDSPDNLPSPDPPHPASDLQSTDSAREVHEPEQQTVKLEKEDEENDEDARSAPQVTSTGLQAMAADLVNQAKEDAQEEVIKFISEDRVLERDVDAEEKVVNKCEAVSVEKGAVPRVEGTASVSCDQNDVTHSTDHSEQPGNDTEQHSAHGEVETHSSSGELCDSGETLNENCEKNICAEVEVEEGDEVQQNEVVAANEDSANKIYEDIVAVAAEPFVSINSSPSEKTHSSDSSDSHVHVSIDGASTNVDNSSASKHCAKHNPETSDCKEESESLCQVESIATVTALQASIEIPSHEKQEKCPKEKSESICTATEELETTVKTEAESTNEEHSDSESQVPLENIVELGAEITIGEPSEDHELKLSTDKDATPSAPERESVELQQCKEVHQTITINVDDAEAAVEKQEPPVNLEATLQHSLSTPEKESGQVSPDEKCLETHTEQTESSPETDPAASPNQKANPSTGQVLTEPRSPTVTVEADTAAESSGNGEQQLLNGDHGTGNTPDMQVDEEERGEVGEVMVNAQCNGCHVPEANSSDTIDAYLKLQDGAEQVHKAAHAEKIQDIISSTKEESPGEAERDASAVDGSDSRD
ncbi:uncharacterized protein LOC143283527 [Babylonia areolata]|uniref:uncharacterized protein LOC143283527 n=1 Tax=Babylonia areolata TaxID=304850 RepID=UPI003FD18B3A